MHGKKEVMRTTKIQVKIKPKRICSYFFQKKIGGRERDIKELENRTLTDKVKVHITNRATKIPASNS